MTEAPTFRRARSPEAKAERRRALIAAAAALMDEGGAEAVTLGALAARAGMVKSAVYGYFASREEILLRLMLVELEDLAAELEAALAPLAGAERYAETARRIAAGFAARPRLCTLAGLLATVLERQFDGPALLEIKTELLAVATRFAVAGRAACPSVGTEGWALASRLAFSLVAGHWAFTNPAPHVAEILARPDFAPIRKDFEADLAAGLAALLRGLAAPPPDPK
ncbi:MAG TPA: TetR family transcriptional regulator [Paracoccaceae bacterium]|nr:TetR family transcriptional regulator [Paracoccaceae bacterium]